MQNFLPVRLICILGHKKAIFVGAPHFGTPLTLGYAPLTLGVLQKKSKWSTKYFLKRMFGSICNRYLPTRGFNVEFNAKTPFEISGFSGFPRFSWHVRNRTFSFFFRNFFWHPTQEGLIYLKMSWTVFWTVKKVPKNHPKKRQKSQKSKNLKKKSSLKAPKKYLGSDF